uniref:Uncharacterized protein n=1 Tax=Ditylenchus dipsaci TaxID=166011 RepID=A0A915D312_9BILA
MMAMNARSTRVFLLAILHLELINAQISMMPYGRYFALAPPSLIPPPIAPPIMPPGMMMPMMMPPIPPPPMMMPLQ